MAKPDLLICCDIKKTIDNTKQLNINSKTQHKNINKKILICR